MLVILVFLLLANDEVYQVDELPVGRVMSFAGTGNQAIAHFLGRTPSFHIAIFDLEKQHAHLLRDGRLRVIQGECLVLNDSFVVIDYLSATAPKAHVLSQQGEYLNTLRLNEFDGWTNSTSFYGVGYDSEGAPLLLLSTGAQTLKVAEMKLAEKALRFVAQEDFDPSTELLAYFRGKWVRINKHTSKTVFYGNESKPQLVYPAQPPIPGRKSAFNLPGAKIPAYQNVIPKQYPGPNRLQLAFHDYYDEGPDPSEKAVLKVLHLDGEAQLDATEAFLVHEHQGTGLYLTYEGQTFFFKK